MKTWIEVEARFAERPKDTSLFADAFENFGCNSSLESEEPPAIRGYLEAVSGSLKNANRLKAILLERGASEVRINEVPDEDWSEIWKQHFKPRRVGKRLVVVPSWEDFEEAEQDIVLKLDPGQAFGTGEHPTTQLCLELLEQSELAGKSVLDIGCGSGILAIAAAKLGAKSVTAVDIDGSAIQITIENSRVNGIRIETYASEGIAEWSQGRKWDIVVSNIISATLMRISDDVLSHLESNGIWIVSGVLQNNWKDLYEDVRNNFDLIELKERDEWVAAAFRCKS
jgi:ribosomal protein L11 methyltransferase